MTPIPKYDFGCRGFLVSQFWHYPEFRRPNFRRLQSPDNFNRIVGTDFCKLTLKKLDYFEQS